MTFVIALAAVAIIAAGQRKVCYSYVRIKK